MKNSSDSSLSYADAGVNIDAGNRLVDNIKTLVKRTHRPEVLGGIGGFAGLCKIPAGYKEPVLVSGTDGVGTKLKLAQQLQRFDTIGIDLVAMCVNDLIVVGAEPLFFLDYYACGKLDETMAANVIKGVALGCEQAGAALVGGETAEMPGVYQNDDYDIAGFCVGVVEHANIIDGKQVQTGDALIGLASSGVHSNGFSLVHKILETQHIDLNTQLDGKALGDILIEPTRIYIKSLLALLKQINVHAMAHITGGGLTENLPRVLPDNTRAQINTNSWQWPAIFSWLQQQGNVKTEEMYRAFNCGVGMVLCVAQADIDNTLKLLAEHGETAWLIGEITASEEQTPHVEFIES